MPPLDITPEDLAAECTHDHLARPVAPTKCRFCGGTGKVTTYTSAGMPPGTSRCPMCAGDGVCRTPDGCRDHGCHGGCLPAPDAAPSVAQAQPEARTAAIPPVPLHPDPRAWTWSVLEREVIERYGRACLEAGAATSGKD